MSYGSVKQNVGFCCCCCGDEEQKKVLALAIFNVVNLTTDVPPIRHAMFDSN